MVADSTTPPSVSQNGATSVPPPAKEMRNGAFARTTLRCLARPGMETCGGPSVSGRAVARPPVICSSSGNNLQAPPLLTHNKGSTDKVLDIALIGQTRSCLSRFTKKKTKITQY